MYISRIHLSNWRSYSDSEFGFDKPNSRRPLVLIGAMNGHGKTSLLFALYVGLFGRFGLRHSEGIPRFDGEDTPRYREAIRRFRRSTAPADEPTSIEIEFSPTKADEGAAPIRIVRRWYFTPTGQPRLGDGFESVTLYVDEKPQPLQAGADAAVGRLERYLFRADVMPAFFFDGEQAQTLIDNSGQDGMKKAVEVLFGTKVVEESFEHVKQFIQFAHSKLGGKRNADSQQGQLDERIERRDTLERVIETSQRKLRELEQKREQLESEQRNSQETLARLGGERKADLLQSHAEVERAETEMRAAERALAECTKKLGLGLCVSRLAPAIVNRLKAEAARERWESLRDGTVTRIDEVLDLAIPEPAKRDALLGNLSADVRRKVRDRFKAAIEHIYNPPPSDCAGEYILGHVKGEARTRLLALLAISTSQGISEVRGRAKRLAEARQQLEDALWRRDRIGNLPEEVEKLSELLAELGGQISDTSRQLGAVENEIRKHRSELQDVSAEIGRLQETLAKLGPEQKRIAVAERVRTVLSNLNDQLRPITVRRLQDSVTSHFVRIADRRYQGGKIVFPDNGSPVLRRANHPDALVEMMSGFERRAFGISFSLALAEITKRRIPLVIDTPLGNADQAYRRRLLKALTNVDLDQIIILTHDAEVTGALYEEIGDKVKQTFLLEYDRQNQETRVVPNSYFEGVGR